MDDVKTSRGSRAHRRHAEATRSRIVEAAHRLMVQKGYGRTSISDIARAADVAVQTVYNAVGSKREVLDAVLDAVAAGPGAPRRVPEFMAERAGATSTAREMVAVLATWFAESQPRVAPVIRLIREAAAHDDSIAELERRRASQRLANYGRAADQLRERPGARELPREDVAAIIWSIGHPQTYAQLVEVEGWSIDAYAGWVERSLAVALLEG
ncbi:MULTISPECIES: TetR/AcrR family transcriptional regulator [Demequina]|uniref:TetR/AcrR family transcriptional regulator n=1 Tax=Demequina TaxID=577469 RepID=UPI0007819501|nr:MULTISPECIES: TetR/AcrR family transcriptional regulator [Demequina]